MVRSRLLLGAALGCLAALTARAAPLQVGSGNEAAIEPPVPHPDETPCTVPLVTKGQFGADGISYSYAPPSACPGPWAKVVLSMAFSLNEGRQFDRSGQLFLAGVPLWFGTTAEPRATRTQTRGGCCASPRRRPAARPTSCCGSGRPCYSSAHGTRHLH